MLIYVRRESTNVKVLLLSVRCTVAETEVRWKYLAQCMARERKCEYKNKPPASDKIYEDSFMSKKNHYVKSNDRSYASFYRGKY
jgi:hypothetical protein